MSLFSQEKIGREPARQNSPCRTVVFVVIVATSRWSGLI
jgi:hypothetical protein